LRGSVLLDVAHKANNIAIALDLHGKQFSQGEGSAVRVWDVDAKSSRVLPALATDDIAFKLAFSPDGRTLIVGGAKGGVAIVALSSGLPIGSPSSVSGEVRDIVISPDSRHAVVTGEDGRSGLYDLGSGKTIAILSDTLQAAGDLTARALRQGVN